jgi:hypothetical protein
MAIIKANIDKIIELIKDNKIEVYYNKNWRYPNTGDDFRTCPLLEAMFNIEKRSGYIIFIPANKEES